MLNKVSIVTYFLYFTTSILKNAIQFSLIRVALVADDTFATVDQVPSDLDS